MHNYSILIFLYKKVLSFLQKKILALFSVFVIKGIASFYETYNMMVLLKGSESEHSLTLDLNPSPVTIFRCQMVYLWAKMNLIYSFFYEGGPPDPLSTVYWHYAAIE